MKSRYLLITVKFFIWIFLRWEIRPFFKTKGLWKNDIYRLLESSCFESFGDGKYGLFWAKKLMERWPLVGDFELLIILQDLAKIIFVQCGIGHLTHQYKKANNKYMKSYYKNKEWSYLMCLDGNESYRWTMPQ